MIIGLVRRKWSSRVKSCVCLVTAVLYNSGCQLYSALAIFISFCFAPELEHRTAIYNSVTYMSVTLDGVCIGYFNYWPLIHTTLNCI
jgi:hypothetical protein